MNEHESSDLFVHFKCSAEAFFACRDQLLKYSCKDLFTKIIPSYIFDLGKLNRPFLRPIEKGDDEDKLQFLISVFLIKRYDDFSLLDSFKKKDYSLLYERYKQMIDELNLSSFNLLYSFENFVLLYNSIFSIKVKLPDVDSLRSLEEKDIKLCRRLVKSFKKNLVEDKKTQYQICADFYSKPEDEDYYYGLISNKTESDLVEENLPSQFTGIRDVEKRKIEFTNIVNALYNSQAMSILSSLYFLKGDGSMNQETALVWENTLVRKFFFPQVENPSSMLICFPSPDFIKYCIEIKYDVDTVFVMECDSMARILDNEYQGQNLKNKKFIGVDLLKEEIEKRYENGRDFKDILILSPSKFGNIESEIKDLIKHQCHHDPNIYVLDAECSFNDEMSFSCRLLKDQDFFISDMLFLPRNAGFGPIPRIQVFYKFSRRRADDDSTTSCIMLQCINSLNKGERYATQTEFGLDDVSPKLLVFSTSTYKKADLLEYYESDAKSLRNYLYKAKPGGKTNKERISSKPVQYTDEITFWYSKSPYGNDENKFRVEVYICDDSNRKKDFTDFSPRGKRVHDSIKRKVCSENDIIPYVLNEYPNAIVSKRGISEEDNRKHQIKDVVIETYRKILVNRKISLRTFLFLYPELTENFDDENKKAVEGLLNSDISDGILDSYPFDYFGNVAERLSSDAGGNRSPQLYLALISNIIDEAIARNHCSHNIIDQTLSENDQVKSNYKKAFRSVRDALAKKCFTAIEFKKLIAIITYRIQLDFRYLGILIKLFTGLSENEICALKWKDFHQVKGYGFYVFQIYKQMTASGEDISDFESDNDYRVLPCVSLLESKLLEYKAHLESKGFTDEMMEESYILSDIEKQRHVSPRELAEIRRDVLNAIEIEDVPFSFPDEKNGVKETNLSRYQGDIFRENIRYWAINKGMFNEDEISYFLGNVRKTTFGIYYCDYFNDGSLFILYSKMKRLESYILYGENIGLFETKTVKRNEIRIKAPNSYYPLELELEMRVNKPGTVCVSVESDYGVRYACARGKKDD